MDEDLTTEISDTPAVIQSGQDLIDATQNAIIDAAENVSEVIGVSGKSSAVTTMHEPFYAEVHFWVGVAFVLAILCILKPILKFIKEALQRRIAKVVTDIEEASKLRDDAQVLLSEYERKFVSAQTEVTQLIDKSRQNIQNVKKREMSKLKIELQNKEKEAERRIAAATEKTKAEINLSASKVSIDLAHKAINRYLQTTDKSKLIDEAIIELDKFIKHA